MTSYLFVVKRNVHIDPVDLLLNSIAIFKEIKHTISRISRDSPKTSLLLDAKASLSGLINLGSTLDILSFAP